MASLQDLPVLGIGIGYRPELHREQSRYEDRIDWFELIADRYLRSVPESIERALEMLGRHPLIPHGLEMSVGTDEPLDPGYLGEVNELVHALGAPFYSDHLCMTKAGGLEIGQLTPLPFTEATAERCAAKARQVQRALGVPFLLENISYGFAFPSPMSEAGFIRRVVTDADCGMLLDLANVFINSQNHRYDPYAFLDALPLERVIQVHLAGGEVHAGRWVDSHSQSVDAHPEVWKLLEFVVQRAPVRAILIERDQNFPTEFAEMLEDIEHAREIFRGAQRPAAPAPVAAAPLEVRSGTAAELLPVDEHRFQRALARVVVEPETRRRFLADPAAAGEQLGLGAPQISALVAAGVDQIDLFAREVASKRFLLIAKSCPATYKRLQQQGLLHDVMHPFIEQHIPRETPEFANRTVRDSFWFLDFLGRQLASGALHCLHLADIVRFERVQLSLYSAPGVVESARVFGDAREAFQHARTDEILAARPRTGPHAPVERFSCNIVDLIKRITAGEAQAARDPSGRGETIEDLRPEPSLVLFTKEPGFRNVRHLGINERTRRLIELCDGDRTVAEIAALLSPDAAGDEAIRRAGSCADIMRALVARNALTLAPPAVSC